MVTARDECPAMARHGADRNAGLDRLHDCGGAEVVKGELAEVELCGEPLPLDVSAEVERVDLATARAGEEVVAALLAAGVPDEPLAEQGHIGDGHIAVAGSAVATLEPVHDEGLVPYDVAVPVLAGSEPRGLVAGAGRLVARPGEVDVTDEKGDGLPDPGAEEYLGDKEIGVHRVAGERVEPVDEVEQGLGFEGEHAECEAALPARRSGRRFT